ncbi:hypothetical protein [Capillimicrobium parvum]|uniref:Uncharacterized protein n=1 Tax=Capillimicrobium parvum TaxID=2884022 RepID=A0A9E7C1Q2_9ACTN|nr:hypothetical protein [Capillimicrobium parvum]UGS37725.1 hypothetical protein DSM104329_04146 [Capillimicrobium parvum]
MTLRAAALLALVAFGVHEARYLIVPDVHANAGHGYLSAVPVLLALALAFALGRSLTTVGRPALARRGPSWGACSAALLAIHGGQEGLERVLAGGGPFDAGLLVVVPLCIVGGLVVCALLRRTERLLEAAVAAGALPRPRISAPATIASGAPLRVPAPSGMARHLAGRSPPTLG